MGLLKSLWPTPFKVKEKDVVSLIVQLIIFVIICAVIVFLIGILDGIPIIGFIFIIIGSLMELYGFIGILLCIFKFFGLVK